MNDALRFGMVGAGFWAGYQLAAWGEVAGAQCAAICDPAPGRAEALAQSRGIAAWYTDARAMLHEQRLDFIDIVSPPATHIAIAELALEHRLPVICQKPLAEDWDAAEAIVERFRQAGVPLLVHENWRWQAPIRAVKAALVGGQTGEPFRARIAMVSGFPVFANQPGLRSLERFILMDMGTHLLDVARFLFGEAQTAACQTRRVNAGIAGEDVATVLLEMNGVTVICEMGYAGNHLEEDAFPETRIFIEASRGSIELAPHYRLRVTTEAGTHSRLVTPARYSWADPRYDVVQASMPDCLRNLLGALNGEGAAETTGADNLETLRLVMAAYRAAESQSVVKI